MLRVETLNSHGTTLLRRRASLVFLATLAIILVGCGDSFDESGSVVHLADVADLQQAEAECVVLELRNSSISVQVLMGIQAISTSDLEEVSRLLEQCGAGVTS